MDWSILTSLGSAGGTVAVVVFFLKYLAGLDKQKAKVQTDLARVITLAR